MNKLAVLEGLLFVVGDEGLDIEQITNIMDIEANEAQVLLKQLQEEYEKDNRGIRISFLANVFKLTTKKEHFSYYQKLVKENPTTTLSQAALETLAIIAYNEPITRVEVDKIRGIASSFLIRKLLSKDLIKVCGKSDLPGHPNLYKTTNDFLDHFGLTSIKDLPKINTEEKNDDEVDLYRSTYKDEPYKL